MSRGDLTDVQWARLEPLLPTGKKPGRPPMWTRRQLIDGIRWRTRTGAPWRGVPGPPARRRGAEKGDVQAESPGGLRPSRPTMGLDARAPA
ncbi:transposase [Actinomadura sp. 6N118]|uniref:transposase n=1 Tax=Actinomadura sp. 6N118 TaxID=3375151 RepID=UPI0037A67FFB